MTSNTAKAFAAMQYISGLESYDDAVKVYDAMANTFGPIDDVLWFYDTKRHELYDRLEGEMFWEMVETAAVSLDQTIKYFENAK
jgi:hypothetical protein